MQNSKKINILALIFVMQIGIAYSTNYYCDPASGNMNNEGTISNTWGSLSEVFNENKEFSFGDTIFLLGGVHGEVIVKGNNTDYVVITSLDDNIPVLSSLVINNSSYWKFKGLDISKRAPETNYNVYYVADEYFLVQTDKKSSNIRFEKCNIYTVGVDVNTWTRNDWYTGTLSGMMLRSKNTIVDQCVIRNTNFSLEVHGRYTEFTNSTIENFVGDAIRALSSYSKYEYNTVKNSYDITGYDDNTSGQNPDYPVGSGNHDDLFQSYTSRVGGTEYAVTDVIVRYNKFYSYTDIEQVDKSYTQGIALFDGFFNNWTIENNLIVTDSWHGITMLGTNDAVIANNTIIGNPIRNDLILGNGVLVDDMTPFIWVGKTKSGEKSYDNTVRNNLIIQSKFSASNYKNIIDEAENTLIQNNQTVPASLEENYFVDYQNFDINTGSNSPAIDQGINIDLLVYDLNAVDRLMGKAVDCGAYEFDNSSEGNTCPVIKPIDNQKVKQFQKLEIEISVTDADESPIYLEASELPEFITFVDNGNGKAVFTVRPLKDDLGIYEISILASDEMENTNKRTFLIEVQYGTSNILTKNNSQFEVYPNPIKRGDLIYITIPDCDLLNPSNVNVFDLRGIKKLAIKPLIQNGVIIVQTNGIRESGMFILNYKGYNKTISIQ